tara:strand:+ start:13298 stop:13522 length:225 start_codon:yes stop_codon:yes gene_type:complete
MDDNPEFMKRFLGLVQGVKSGTLSLQIDGDIVVLGISIDENKSKEIRIPSHLFMTSDVNNILVALGERDKNENQ